ncbi:miniconductance mechanosensitive channel [Lishizhenia tianjinensis]|uniref:Mechanosensing system component YbdG n=1 Tax=Lishizhenia tianjinensis TaxID=477690 RepID=A0A1I6Z0W4_9FLAO|nr:mechanosensitive ion channel family protein [Lishizhenia tianjinensis]SFT56355.1 miniconductance mechanosensitive channel [Lishizhenia tianjinensis]
MRDQIKDWILSFYQKGNMSAEQILESDAFQNHQLLWTLGLFVAMIILSLFVWILSRQVMLQLVHMIADRSKTEWDDILVKNKFFYALAQLVPLFFMDYMVSIVFAFYEDSVENYALRVIDVVLVFVILISILRFLNSLRDILQQKESLADKPINSYIQVSKIVLSIMMVMVMLSVITDKSALKILTAFGAMTAIILLVFKDTILGFVSSIQLSANDMVRIGDWVTMEKFGADGDVIEVNLATVKVQNFDKTITTIPTYSMISDSFKNWRGMQDSDGRRIKRAVLIHIDSVKFASPALIERLSKEKYLTEFIAKRQAEIKKYNDEHGYSADSLQARKQTNLGLFRAYMEFYLENNPNINQDMSLMVRQLEPRELGVPMEVYCFSKIKDWEPYEGVVADIFDHIFASIHAFELTIFESPSGRDMRNMVKGLNA